MKSIQTILGIWSLMLGISITTLSNDSTPKQDYFDTVISLQFVDIEVAERLQVLAKLGQQANLDGSRTDKKISANLDLGGLA
ncbi:hypothetical protein [Polynucleobacter asymbioticus]|nr:hypothetical protein [Polynucleobacter asymbioticus]